MTIAVAEIDAVTGGSVTGAEKPFMRRIRLRAQRRVLWMRSLWNSESSGSEQGLAISHAEVDRILTSAPDISARESEFYQTDPRGLELTALVRDADDCAARDPAWLWLRAHLGLTAPDADLLALCVAAELDPLLRRVYGYLHDDATAAYATGGLASNLFQWPLEMQPGPQSALVRWLLARPAAATSNWSAATPWMADPHIVLWMTRGAALDPALGNAVHAVPASESQKLLCIYPTQLASMREFALAFRGVGSAEINLVGTKGAGKRVLAAQLAAALGYDLICVDASMLIGGDVAIELAVERVIRAARLAHLAGALLCWRDAEAANPKIWHIAADFSALVLLSSHIPLLDHLGGSAARYTVELSALPRSVRVSLWNRTTSQPVPDGVANCPLEPAAIVDAARLSAAGARGAAAAYHSSVHLEPAELFTALPCSYTWDDIMLPGALRGHLEEIERQIRLRWEVYEEWGFERLCPLGRGVTAMFAGPSGTGKTMAAQVLAGSLGMKLYRVDLSGVINKYIGETEKRLRRVFDACERANVVLLFDEADALFGHRTQVKDAHDRFANIEIDYLLQRMERFDGVAILATNRKGDLDKAFLRRIRFIVDFVPPGPAERVVIWQRVLAPRSPAGEQLLDHIDWQYLADVLNFTGAEIRAAALSAAFLARAEGTRIGMKHVLQAAQRELTKNGAVLRADGWGGR